MNLNLKPLTVTLPQSNWSERTPTSVRSVDRARLARLVPKNPVRSDRLITLTTLIRNNTIVNKIKRGVLGHITFYLLYLLTYVLTRANLSVHLTPPPQFHRHRFA